MLDNEPVTADNGPVMPDNVPVAADNGPVMSDAGSVVADNTPMTADYTPATTDIERAEFFQYTQADLDALKKKDKKLAAVIDRYGAIRREVNRDLFSALVGSIISQQISSKAADTIERRLLSLCGEITPASVHAADLSSIQRCGTSTRKAGYIKEAAKAVYSGTLDLTSLAGMPDEDIISLLSGLPGIGVWTAEMLLIFSLGRMDVLSYGDLAIRRGLRKLYGHKTLTKERFAIYKKRYSPYGSIASLYLWRLSVD